MKKQTLIFVLVFMILLLVGCPNNAGGDKNGGNTSGDDGTGGTFAVSFDSNGGNYSKNFTVNSGEKITPPEDPRKQDWQFAGWFSDEAFQTKWNFDNDVVTEDVTLYAKWVTPSNPGNVNPQLVGNWTFTDTNNKVVLRINISSDGTATNIQLVTEGSKGYLLSVPDNNYFIDDGYLKIPKSVFSSFNQGKVVVTFNTSTTGVLVHILTYQTNDILPLGSDSIRGSAKK